MEAMRTKKSKSIPESVRVEAYKKIVMVGAKVNEISRGLNGISDRISYGLKAVARG